jgi:hypothetical protein
MRSGTCRGSGTWMLIAVLLAAGACGQPDDDGNGGRDARDGAGDDGTAGADADADADAPAEVRDFGEAVDGPVCDEQDFEFHHEIVRIMILLDQSSSMIGSSWTAVTTALETLLDDSAFIDMYFGLDAFPDGYPGGWADCGALCLRCMNDSCGILFPPQVPVDICYRSRDAIIDHMNDPAFPPVCSNTPLVNQLEYYDTGDGPTTAPEMYDAEGSNYLLVVSDGEDANCYTGDAVAALAAHAESLRTTRDIRSFAIGITGTTTGTMADQLNAIASHGGTAFTTFLRADDEAGIADAFRSIASSVITCTYVLDAPEPTADPELVNFYLDGTVVPQDPGCTEDSGAGWDWTDAGHTTIHFCGDYCTQVRSGSIGTITATFGCSTILI